MIMVSCHSNLTGIRQEDRVRCNKSNYADFYPGSLQYDWRPRLISLQETIIAKVDIAAKDRSWDVRGAFEQWQNTSGTVVELVITKGLSAGPYQQVKRKHK